MSDEPQWLPAEKQAEVEAFARKLVNWLHDEEVTVETAYYAMLGLVRQVEEDYGIKGDVVLTRGKAS